MSVGELFDRSVETAASLTAERHLVFDWELLEAPWDGEALRAAIEARVVVFGAGRWPTAVLSNHDRPRQASRLAVPLDGADPDAVARAARDRLTNEAFVSRAPAAVVEGARAREAELADQVDRLRDRLER